MHPVDIEVTSPPHFDRIQILLRFGLTIVLGWVGITAGWMAWMLYAILPLAAAITISSDGERSFRESFAPRIWRVLVWLVQFAAYMMLLVDRFPTGDEDGARVELHAYTKRTSVARALVRVITSIPSALVLALLGIVSMFLHLIAIVTILVARMVPRAILAYQRGMLRWLARLLAYHGSLVDEYPPLAFDTDEGHGRIHAVAL
jgi:hypothetical protein